MKLGFQICEMNLTNNFKLKQKVFQGKFTLLGGLPPMSYAHQPPGYSTLIYFNMTGF